MSEALRVQTEQKLRILAEAAPSEALAVIDLGGGGQGATDHAHRLLAAFGAGSFGGSSAQAFVLRTPSGAIHFYAQPFDGRSVLPGEHHVVLPFSAPAPAAYVSSFTGGDWKSPLAAFEKWLRQHPIQKLVLTGNFDWRLGAGSVKRQWLAQIRPLGDGRSHFVLKGTGEGAVSETKPVGFSLLTRAVLSLVQQPAQAASPVAAEAMYPSAFAALYGQICESGQPLPVLPRAEARDLGAAIHSFLAPHARGKLSVHPCPPSKESNARRQVLPREASHLPIVALLDLTLMGSASEALVLTPTHCFLRSGDVRGHFAWTEVRGTQPPADAHDDQLRVLLAERGWLSLPAGEHAAVLHALMAELAAIPPPAG